MKHVVPSKDAGVHLMVFPLYLVVKFLVKRILDEVVLEDVAAVEAEADRGLLAAVAEPRLSASATRVVERRVDALSSFAVLQPTKAIYLSPAIFCAHLIASSVTPSQFGITSSNGRLPLIFSFQTSAPLPLTLPA
jgi:hypothetical protein